MGSEALGVSEMYLPRRHLFGIAVAGLRCHQLVTVCHFLHLRCESQQCK